LQPCYFLCGHFDGVFPLKAKLAPGYDGGAKPQYDGIKAFIVPIGTSALLLSKLLKNGTLKVYEKYPHGMATTHADVINADLRAFIKG
jgi:hypothetical protein